MAYRYAGSRLRRLPVVYRLWVNKSCVIPTVLNLSGSNSVFAQSFASSVDKLTSLTFTMPKRRTASEKEEQTEEKQIKTKGKKSKVEKKEEEESSSKRSKRQTKATSYVEEVDEEDDEDSSEEKKPKARGKRAAPAPKSQGKVLNQTETDYDNIEFSCSKKNADGKASNFKISSWNVGGLRAWLKKGGLTYIEYEKPDVFCIQESKCSEDKMPPEIKDVEDYKQYWHNSSKDGYAGVGLFSRTEPLSVEYGIGVEDHDDEGRCITAEFDEFYVISVYVPNAGKKLITLPKRLEWNKAFKTYVQDLDKKKPVIVCGDMNVAHSEIDLANPKTNTKNAGFTKEEREGMTEFLEDGYVDSFRKFYPDETGAYTFWTYLFKARSKNVGWRLDYFIVSERYMDSICDNVIRSEVFGSDHCPIVLFLNV